MFADDTSLKAVGKTLSVADESVNNDLMNVRTWLASNKLSLNIAKTEYILIGSRPKTRNTCMQQPLAFISKHCVNMKYFGLYQQ